MRLALFIIDHNHWLGFADYPHLSQENKKKIYLQKWARVGQKIHKSMHVTTGMFAV